MLTALNQAGALVLASDATRIQGGFFCPECGEPLTLRKGAIKIHHFAHKADAMCWYGYGETEEHRIAKTGLFMALRSHPSVQRVALESRLDDHTQRADVLFETNQGIQVAVELQRSHLEIEEVSRRTLGYTAHGIAVLWLVIGLDGKANTPIQKEWQKWLHAMYFGRLYSYVTGSTVQVWRKTDILESVPWSEEPRLRRNVLALHDRIDIVNDMIWEWHEPWKGYPRALIWNEITRKTWERDQRG